MNAEPVYIQMVKTPNPEAMKFEVMNRKLTEGAFEFVKDADQIPSPLAAAILNFETIQRVFIGPNFITLTKHPDAPEWEQLQVMMRMTLKKLLETEGMLQLPPQPAAEEKDELQAELAAAVSSRLGKAAQQDGGNIRFLGISDGIVEVEMQGACVGCPFAPRTLKDGVEAFLKQHFPEVKAVQCEQVKLEDVR